MRYIFLTLFCVFFFACSVSESSNEIETAALSMSQERSSHAAAVPKAQLITAIVTITSINQNLQQITLKNNRGAQMSFDIAPAIKGLDAVSIGDTVVINFYQPLAFSIHSINENSRQPPTHLLTPDAKSRLAFPIDMLAGDVFQSTATVVGMDSTLGNVTIRFSDTSTNTFLVLAPDGLKALQLGDMVAVTYSKALVVSIEQYQG